MLLHVPSGTELPNVELPDAQRCAIPIIGPGRGFTFTVAEATQPSGVVKTAVAYPGVSPVTDPVTGLTDIEPLPGAPDHDPIAVRSCRVVAEPEQTVVSPVIAEGAGLIVTV